MFVQIFDELSEAVWNKLDSEHSGQNKQFKDALNYSIEEWCKKLSLDQESQSSIFAQLQDYDLRQITQEFWEEYKPTSTKKGRKSIFSGYLKEVFNKLKLVSEKEMNFILMIAFVLTATGLVYLLLKRQQNDKTYEHHQPLANTLYSPVQKSIKNNLLLVVSAAQGENVIKSLQEKGDINSIDGEALYEFTRYLCLGARSEFNERINDANNYLVSKGNETINDIYLVNIKVEQADERFQPDVNPIDRRDAFYNLSNLENGFTITPRLKMEAYKFFEVYS